MTEYEIYVSCVHGSDVVTKDTLEEAIEVAEKWSMEVVDCNVIIEKVERTIVNTFRYGGELG